MNTFWDADLYPCLDGRGWFHWAAGPRMGRWDDRSNEGLGAELLTDFDPDARVARTRLQNEEGLALRQLGHMALMLNSSAEHAVGAQRSLRLPMRIAALCLARQRDLFPDLLRL